MVEETEFVDSDRGNSPGGAGKAAVKGAVPDRNPKDTKKRRGSQPFRQKGKESRAIIE